MKIDGCLFPKYGQDVNVNEGYLQKHYINLRHKYNLFFEIANLWFNFHPFL
jgi:hypothetical protein